MFDSYIGIDYSGAQTAESRMRALQVYRASGHSLPENVLPNPDWGRGNPNNSPVKNWSREDIARSLIERAQAGERYFCGIDHAFGFPAQYHQRYGIRDWNHFLVDFTAHWPLDAPHMYVDFIRQDGRWPRNRPQPKTLRFGEPHEFRLCEQWTSSAKSVFRFDVQGSVAKSTFSGLPWLLHIRQALGNKVHFWPFDGWALPTDRCVIAEIYPSLVSRRFPKQDRRPDAHDAYAVARWLAESSQRGILERYAQPPLTQTETRVAELEGWIFGVS